MKMQIWKIYISEGMMDANHGGSHPIYEAFVPELKLAINHLTSFVCKDDSRYNTIPELPPDNPYPKLICEVELSRTQITDMKQIAGEDNPEDRIRQLIRDILKEENLDPEDIPYE